MLRFHAALVALCSLVALAAAPITPQETHRALDGPGDFHKFLTPGTIDRWSFEGKAGETLIAVVTTRDFDPTLELASGPEDAERILVSVDDAGSTARYQFRLTEDGPHRIRVRGFEDRGGGNYALHVERFTAQTVELGERVVAGLDRDGRARFRFTHDGGGAASVIVGGVDGWRVIDPVGHDRPAFGTGVVLARAGEYVLEVRGHRGRRFDAEVRPAEIAPLAPGDDAAHAFARGDLRVATFMARAGEFRVVDVERTEGIVTRVVPTEDPAADGMSQALDPEPAAVHLPIRSKGGRDRYALQFRKDGRYELHVLATTAGRARVRFDDPTATLPAGDALPGDLDLAATRFFTFPAKAGDQVTFDATSSAFDPVLLLFGADGTKVAEDDDGGGASNSRVRYTAFEDVELRLAVTSVGGGGSGAFALRATEARPAPLTLGEPVDGEVASGGSVLWSVDGAEGQVVILHLRPDGFGSRLVVRDSRGVVLGSDETDGLDRSSLLAVRFPSDGRYLVEVVSRSGNGRYRLTTHVDD